MKKILKSIISKIAFKDVVIIALLSTIIIVQERNENNRMNGVMALSERISFADVRSHHWKITDVIDILDAIERRLMDGNVGEMSAHCNNINDCDCNCY